MKMSKATAAIILFLISGSTLFGTVTSTNNSVTYTCSNSTGPFSFSFPAYDAGSIQVIETVGTTSTTIPSSQYTITIVNHSFANGGSISLSTACATGNLLTIQRVTEETQLSSFTEYMPALYKTFEYGLDKLTEEIQDLPSSVIPTLLSTSLALKPAVADAVQYVSKNGSDSNDGFSEGSAVADIGTAYGNLPSCTVANDLNPFTNPPSTYNSYTFSHCGKIYVAEGTYTVSSQITISSPFVTVEGQGQGAVINWIGTAGTAIKWTSSPFAHEFINAGGLFNVRIDGYNGSAGTWGLNTYNLSSFHAARVTIANFSGSGSGCWNNTMDSGWNEKYDVEITTDNCTTHWQVQRLSTGSGSTYGYGRFEVKSIIYAGQTGFVLDGGTQGSLSFDNSFFHYVANEVSNTANDTVMLLRNGASMIDNVCQIHMEAPYGIGTGNEINISSNSSFACAGELDQASPSSNLLSGGFNVFNPLQAWLQFRGDRQVSLLDSDFELSGSGTYPVGLPPVGWTPSNSPTLAYETSTAYNGKTRSLKITGSTQYEGVFSQNFPVAAGDTYSIQCAAKSDGTGTADCNVQFKNESGSNLASASATTMSTSWTALSASATAPANATYGTVVLQNDTSAGAGATWFDDIVVRKVDFSVLVASGRQASLSGTGACATITTQKGGSWAGSFVCTGTTGTSTITVTAGPTAPNGWVLTAYDMNDGVHGAQTAYTTTTASASFSSVTQNAVLTFTLTAF
jgi:hypothetical protein